MLNISTNLRKFKNIILKKNYFNFTLIYLTIALQILESLSKEYNYNFISKRFTKQANTVILTEENCKQPNYFFSISSLVVH